MKLTNLVIGGWRSAAVARGGVGPRRAGAGPHLFKRPDGTEYLAWKVRVPNVVDIEDGEEVQIGGEGSANFTNDAGVALDIGDVVVIVGETVTTTTTPQYTGLVGVIVAGADDAGDVLVQTHGKVDQVNTTGTVLEGEYLETSTSAGDAQSSATRRTGSFAEALADGPNPPAILFGTPDSTGTGTSSSSIRASHLMTAIPFPIITHRGDINPVDGYPENTLEAFLQGARRGCHGQEITSVRSSDGTWYVIHDLTVDRTTDGTGNVTSKTDAQMNALNIDGGYGYNASRHGTSLNVPTLSSVLDAITPYDGILMIVSKENTDESVGALAEYIVSRDLVGRTIMGIRTLTQAAVVKAINPNFDVLGGITDTPDPEDEADLDRVLVEVDDMDQTYVTDRGRIAVDVYVSDAKYGADETAYIQEAWDIGIRTFWTNDLPNALLARNVIVLGESGATGGGRWEVVVSGTAPPVAVSTPADDDWVYAWVSG